jgi:hypothetical protein
MILNTSEERMIGAMLRVYFDRDNAEITGYFPCLANLNEAVEEWIKSLPCNADKEEGERVPFAVRRAIIRKFVCRGDVKRGLSILNGLRKNGDHYWFEYANMYHGVEPDGYIHT